MQFHRILTVQLKQLKIVLCRVPAGMQARNRRPNAVNGCMLPKCKLKYYSMKCIVLCMVSVFVYGESVCFGHMLQIFVLEKKKFV